MIASKKSAGSAGSRLKGQLGIVKSLAVGSDTFTVTTVKDAGKRLGKFTVNDVMLAAFTGALSRWLQQSTSLRPKDTITCALPVNLRKGDEEYIGNKIGAFTVALPVGVTDPVVRLKKISQVMNAAKRSPEADLGFALGKIVYILPSWISRLFMSSLTSGVECVFTNVRGPDMELHLLGHKIVNFMGFVPPPPGVSLGVAVGSFFGNVQFSISADHALLGKAAPDIAKLFSEELELLTKAA